MNVVHLLSSREFHGAESVVLELCASQIRAGIDTSVILFRSQGSNVSDIRERYERAGVPVKILDVSGRVDRKAAQRLRAQIAVQSVQILHSHKYKTTPYALYAARGTPVKVVSTFHNWLYESGFLHLYARIDKFLAKYCDACVAVSQPVADELTRYVSQSKVLLIRNGVDCDRWRPVERVVIEREAKPYVVGFVGRISAHKGAADLLDAIEILQKINGRPVHALFVGEGELAEDLKLRASRPSLIGRVVFAGTLSDVTDAYEKMDVIALPSRNEGCPMVLLEAMAMGIPAVANDVGDVAKLVNDQKTGRLLQEYGPKLLSDAIRDLLSNDEQRRAMGVAARALICEEFSTDIMVKAYQCIYAKTLDAAG